MLAAKFPSRQSPVTQRLPKLCLGARLRQAKFSCSCLKLVHFSPPPPAPAAPPPPGGGDARGAPPPRPPPTPPPPLPTRTTTPPTPHLPFLSRHDPPHP